MRKLNILLIFGGKSAEHEISIESAKNIANNIDLKKYNLFPLWIDRQGNFFYIENQILGYDSLQNKASKVPAILLNNNKNTYLYNILKKSTITHIDIAFPLIHGPTGEDGILQGYLSMLGLPYIGSTVLPSALCMDKCITKEIISRTPIKIAKYITINDYEKNNVNVDSVIENLHLPLFVKPANLGSSIGITKVKNPGDLMNAINLGFQFDKKIIIEECIVGREIECAVLGNFGDYIIVSKPGEIITKDDFYSYEAKYSDKHITELLIPAKIDKSITNSIKDTALLAYKALLCEDYARVDMFLDNNNNIYLNEINTIPGFTKHSMYPMLLSLEGIPLTLLIDKLIELSLRKIKN
jgi:D-alanine-D-alanine ligase